jgi:penicillin-binding protein 1C
VTQASNTLSLGRERVLPKLIVGLVLLLVIETVLITLDIAFPPDMTRARHASVVALDRNGAWLRALPVERGRWRIRADLDRTDPAFLKRLVSIEDARFWVHPGVDPISAIRATAAALVTGHARSGASTLTMQTARLLEPRPRTLRSKLIECLRAFQLEERLSKRQILAIYLTLAPYGGNLEGVRAASLAYFGHEPETLTPGEQALLIALPQSPEARRPDRKPNAAAKARSQVAEKLVRAHGFTAQMASDADSETIPRRQGFPSLAWQAAGELARAAQDDKSTSAPASVVTTLDGPLQARLERLAAATADAQGPDVTAAILVVGVNDRAVRAAVASAGLKRPGGWIDMTRALRSPGSTLKPFIYGFAFDDGVAAPDTVIDDAPRRFADYQPENFDKAFHGKVTVREALTHSLNVPAVATLDKIGADTFQSRLESSGAVLVRPKSQTKDAGLALALGGEGISLRDLALLYAALADGGVAKPLAWTQGEAAKRPHQGGKRLMRADAASKILDILRETPPPDGRIPAALAKGGIKIAFKTGTSYGFRDALAAGVVGDNVVITWTGRADGGARGDLTGRDSALPMLFDVADVLAAPPSAPRPIPPRNAPQGLQKLDKSDEDGPHLIFPPDGSQVQVDKLGPASRGLVLAAHGDGLAWYVEGRPITPDVGSGRSIWRPETAGFYEVTVVDGQGREAHARVRIRGG